MHSGNLGLPFTNKAVEASSHLAVCHGNITTGRMMDEEFERKTGVSGGKIK